MKISIAQLQPAKGNIELNISLHQRFLSFAVAEGADMIVFPELSLTGYEPRLSDALATTANDSRLNVFQQASDQKKIVIAAGLPTKGAAGNHISMIIFQPGQPRQTYSKQYLHSDEYPFFIQGKQQILIEVKNHRIAPAICFESLLPEHALEACKLGADLYIASVAKSAKGIEKALRHFPKIASHHAMTVLMVNCVGACDDFLSVGQSSAWDSKGNLVGQLSDKDEGMLVFNTCTQEAVEIHFNPLQES